MAVSERLVLNEKYIAFKSYLESVPELFDSMGTSIYEGRNIVRVVEKDGIRFTIKYFKKIIFLNKFIYAHIRKSKAQRSYENSVKLVSRGVTSPEPIAWINCYSNSLLNRSYYISLFTDYSPLEEVFKQPAHQNSDLIRDFAHFSYTLHKKGIFHKDYNVTNVLFSRNNGAVDFSLIDNNRMKFSKYSYIKGIRNMRRLTVGSSHLGIIAQGYAKEVDKMDILVLNDMTTTRVKFLKKYLFKRELKQKIRKFFS